MVISFKLNHYLQQRQQEKARWIFPIKLAMYATYLRNQGHKIIWDKQTTNGLIDKIITEENQIDISFLRLPHADRILTDAFNPKWQQNGNFKYRPGTYIQSASGCWHGKCSFCVEQGQPYEVRPVEDVISEIEECKALGFREIFDDSATFPTGRWLDEFCRNLSRINNIRFSTNMRIVNLDYQYLRQAGFRMLLFGVESANQRTLDKINKGVKVEDIIPTIRKASEAGLELHIAVMFGYPWETDTEAANTLRLVHYLLRKGYAKTAQASFIQCKEIKGNESQKKYVKKIYEAGYYPDFWYHKIKEIKTVEDFRYVLRGIKAALNG